MRELKAGECKEHILNILDVFVEFCNKHHLKYFLGYGTELGAVRHGGFIPWDDDLDVTMPRDDYNKLLELWNVAGYTVLHHGNTKGYHYHFAKISDDSTVLKSRYVNDIDGMGLYVDIFPMEYVTVDARQAERMEKKYSRVLRMLLLSDMKKCWPGDSTLKNFAKHICYLGAKMMGPHYWLKKIERIARSGACESTADAKQFYLGDRVMERAVFSEGKSTLFEGRAVCGPSDADAYLTALYGDYMQLPPESQRISSHDYTAYLKNQSIES